MRVSNHLIERIRERTHLPRKAAISFLYRAIRDGIVQGDIKNKSLKNYVDSTVHDGYYGIVYCRYLIIMSEGTNVGITLLNLPHRYNKLVDNMNFKTKGVKKQNAKRNCNSDEESFCDQWTSCHHNRRQRQVHKYENEFCEMG